MNKDRKPEEIYRIAELAQLDIRDDQLPAMREDMRRMVEFAAQLQYADTSDLSPSCVPDLPLCHDRPDEMQPPQARETLMANAPAQAEGCFTLPRVIEKETV